MKITILLLATYGLNFLVSQTDGPFNLISTLRSYLFRLRFIGPTFFFLFSCPFCLGCWSSCAVYMVNYQLAAKLSELVIWSLAGGAFNLLFEQILKVLNNARL